MERLIAGMTAHNMTKNARAVKNVRTIDRLPITLHLPASRQGDATFDLKGAVGGAPNERDSI